MTGAGPVAFVTGGSSGTGRAVVQALGAEGYVLVLVGRDRAALEATGAASGAPYRVVHADLRDAAATEAALGAGLDWSEGRADALVNAAGVTGPLGSMVGEIGVDAFDDTMAVNLRAPFLTLSALLPVMCARRSGRVVTIGGTHGQRGRPGRAAYVASKWGLRGLHRSAAIEAGPYGVTVNMVMPGPIRVERMERGWAAEAAERGVTLDAVVSDYTARMGGAMGRLNRPEDVAGVVLFLLSASAANITGQEITVDAGTIV